MLRGTAAGLEFVFKDEAFDLASQAIVARLDERPEFYRGSQATAIFAEPLPEDAVLESFLAAVRQRGIDVRGVYGSSGARNLAARVALPYLGEPPRPSVANIARKRAARAVRAAEFSPGARSLDADFAGARADIASRRARGERSVAAPEFGTGTPAAAPPAGVAPRPAAPHLASPATLYHRGTLRGGRSLHQIGTIVVIGDVNPGAELVASGDIVVFGALRGTAHAGAQGDASARVYALELVPTQLRIATLIASGDGGERAQGAQTAFVRGDRIAIAPLGTPEFGA